MTKDCVYAVVSREKVKAVKVRLEELRCLCTDEKIKSAPDNVHYYIPINPCSDNDLDSLRGRIADIIRFVHRDQCLETRGPGNILKACIRTALDAENATALHTLEQTRWNYVIYGKLLLLPDKFFSILSAVSEAHLYRDLCLAFNITHIAVNAPIPLSLSGARKEGKSENILRSPINLTPLHGDFGPVIESSSPTQYEFDSTFWCSAQQNGITQVWAPRYTMFSRGNITEKARIMSLDSMKEVALGCPVREVCCVDLYAGIGYFTFSYARVGVGRVLCWEINPWSVEGLRRGAEANNMRMKLYDSERSSAQFDENQTITVFAESNEFAAERIQALRSKLPSVRHVNCGFLPSSEASWKTAVAVLDPSLGGYIHAHLNIGQDEVDVRAQVTLRQIRQMVADSRDIDQWTVVCQHVERVKSYAPGVLHCVLDLAILPKPRPV